jgi:DNA-binding GntR family transcriptional regulator
MPGLLAQATQKMKSFASLPLDSAQTSAHEEAYRYLSHAIRMGQMKPGDRLVADDIANSMGMSRMHAGA